MSSNCWCFARCHVQRVHIASAWLNMNKFGENKNGFVSSGHGVCDSKRKRFGRVFNVSDIVTSTWHWLLPQSMSIEQRTSFRNELNHRHSQLTQFLSDNCSSAVTSFIVLADKESHITWIGSWEHDTLGALGEMAKTRRDDFTLRKCNFSDFIGLNFNLVTISPGIRDSNWFYLSLFSLYSKQFYRLLPVRDICLPTVDRILHSF